MKISPLQQHIINRLEEGWSLGFGSGISPRVWLQRDGVGRGGPTEDVNKGSFFALLRRGVIHQTKDGFPTSEYGLVNYDPET